MRIGHGKVIKFVFKENKEKNYSDSFIKANNNNELRLLARTKDTYYVLHQPLARNEIINEIPCGFVYDISISEISHAKIMIYNIPKDKMPSGTGGLKPIP